jgi:hypothetical protein
VFVDQKLLLVVIGRLFIVWYQRAIGNGSNLRFHAKLLIGFPVKKMSAVDSLRDE